jgi:hypothetical protein
LTIIATCFAHDLNPRAYLQVITKVIVQGWPKSNLRELLPDQIVNAHPALYVGDMPSAVALAVA